LDAAKGVGKTANLLDIAVYTGTGRDNPHGGMAQSSCDCTGNCLLGCRQHAKNTLDLNYIPLAEKKHGAEVYPLHRADKLERIGDNGYKVHFERLDEDPSGPTEQGYVTGKTVVVAAGTLGSTELLLRSRDVHGTLPAVSTMLGRRFSGNGDLILAGTLGPDRDVDPGRGPNITAGVDCSTPNNRIFIEDLGYPDGFLWFLEGAIPPPGRLRNLFLSVKTYVLATFGLNSGSSRISFEIERIVEGGTTTRFLPYLGMGTDAGDGRLRLKHGSIDIDWRHRQSLRMFSEMEQVLRKMSHAINGRYVTSVLWRWPVRKLLTAHPLGGCIMGVNKDSGVVNEFGEVWGYPGLYVADGSIVPTALSVNPSMTISALAERIAFWIIHGREMGARDPDVPSNQ
jgi:cholesterol oxidase